MKIDQTIDRLVSKKMLEENKQERENHISSGKLSASMLGMPLQWQVLKSIGVPPKEIDEYTLRVFKRGKDIETWLVNQLKDVVDTQVFVEYRDTIGYIDALVDTKGYEFNEGIIPFEVKSVKNSKFKRIVQQGGPDHSHLLQNALYALAKKTKSFEVCYVAADDLRILCYVLETKDYEAEINRVIDNYQYQLSNHMVPKFVPIESWQAMPDYNNYPEWSNLTELEIVEKLKKEYPEALSKLLKSK
jgi:hypothetical protein